MILLDTSAVIELLKGTKKGFEIKTILEPDLAAVSSITLNEVLTGEKRNREILIAFLQETIILPFDEEAAWKSVEIEEELYKKGKPLSKLDLYIASIAMAHNLTIISLDSDFKDVKGLQSVIIS